MTDAIAMRLRLRSFASLRMTTAFLGRITSREQRGAACCAATRAGAKFVRVRSRLGRGSWGRLGPGFEEVGGVDGAEAGGEIVAGGGGVGGVVVVGGGGEFAQDFFVGSVAIVEVAGLVIFAAGDIDVAERDVVEDAGGGGGIAGSLAGVATRGAGGVGELLLGERVVDVVGVALFAVALIDERLNAGHCGRGEGSAAATEKDCVVFGGAVGAALRGV